jgi:non-canonical purine NTP pyrophosphatase (RdgB/HAM1 family)
MTLYFITGNKHKFEQVVSILEPNIHIKQLELDLDEIQEIDSHKVLEHKIIEAQKHHKGEFIVEDVSLCIDALNGLPGPLIKWFLKTLGTQGIYDFVKKLGNTSAKAKVIYGYFDGKETSFFENSIEGDIAPPGKDDGFGWNPIFRPCGYSKVISEMTFEEKISVGLRKHALEKFKKSYLKKK